jgi:putative hemolysin
MKLQNRSENVTLSGLNIPGQTILADTLLRFIGHNKIISLYSQLTDKNPISLINCLLDHLEISIEIPDEDLRNIPSSGAFITVSNHPYRGIDSMLLYRLISTRRSDFKIVASHLLKDIESLKDVIIPVKTFETREENKSSYRGIKECFSYLEDGHGIGIFPTGITSPHIELSRVIIDGPWQPAAVKLIKNSEVPVIPVYFHGTTHRLLSLIANANPINRSSGLPSELKDRKNKIIKIRIGSPLNIREQSGFNDLTLYGQYLRARTYALGSPFDNGTRMMRKISDKKLTAVPLAEQRPVDVLTNEFNEIKSEFELFSTKNYSVVCAPVDKIPEIFREIGRLREKTFRLVGEGTNKSIDVDSYDLYFDHLFIWDTDENRIVGAYRIGRGDHIISVYGIKGFYIDSLFRLSKKFTPSLAQAIELGRSFITPEYQKKAIPLFLLWKGIMVFLLRHPEYRYLIGPVSITNDFSKFSKSLIVEFVRKYFFDEEMSRFITPRKEFIVKTDRAVNRKVFIDTSEKDINKIEKIVMDIQPGYRLPVLLKKYLEINGRIIGFNIDPEFNYCLDGLLILDINNVPPDFLKGLSKELKDNLITERIGNRMQV